MLQFMRIGLVLLMMSSALWGEAPPFKKGQIVIQGKVSQASADMQVIKYLPQSDLSIVRVEPGKEFAALQRQQDKGRSAFLNRLAAASAIPSDPYYSFQWHLQSVQATEAWNLTTGSGVIVAVVDSGLALGGADGVGCVVPGYDFVNMDSDPHDDNGHGTHVSGTVAQATNNGIGVSGLAYDACVMPVKVLDAAGSGGFAEIAEGIYFAVDHGAKVINLSLGINARYALANDPVLDPALDYAEANGVTVVCASGNDGHRKNVSYPAIYPTTIAVGSTDYNNALVSYSNRGKGLDMMAPGGDVSADQNGDGYADGVLQETLDNGSWTYAFWQGTSMAAPHVSAAAALLIAHQTAATPAEVRTVLFGSALDIDKPGFDNNTGHGLLQVYDALLFSGSEPPSPPPPTGTDADGDGVTIEEGDCDDNNAHVYPGHSEKGRWGRDGLDNNCNGVVDG